MHFAAFHESYPGNSSQEVFDVQKKLLQLGFTLDVNGAYDVATSAAVLSFRRQMSMPLVDQIDSSFITTLDMQGRPEFAAAWKKPGMSNAAKYGIAAAAALGAVFWLTR